MESVTSWKRVCYLLVGLSVVQFIFLLNGWSHATEAPALSTACDVLTERFRDIAKQTGHHTEEPLSPEASKSEVPQKALLPWNKLPKGQDGEILDNLSDAQCDFAFPDLYHEIDRSTKYWRDRKHTISKEDTSITWKDFGGDRKNREWGGIFRVLIHDNQIRILEGIGAFDNVWYQSRAKQTLYLLHRALESATAAGEVLPTVEIALTMGDKTAMPTENGTDTVWTFNRLLTDDAQQRHWLIPNFDMWGSGNQSYRDSKMLAIQHDAPFKSKIPKMVWRGAAWVNMPIRGKLMEVANTHEWSDVRKLDGDHDELFMTREDLCKYAMTVHTEGVSYSGRLKWLTDCNSLIFFHEREYDMYYYHLLQPSGPNQNYVAVKRDWSDLVEKVEFYLAHPDEADRIIANNLAMFRERYLTRAAVSCYTRKLINEYSKVAFKPEVQRPASDPHKVLRGIPYEAFMMNPSDVGDKNS